MIRGTGLRRLGTSLILGLAAFASSGFGARTWAQSPPVAPVPPAELESFVDGVLAEGMRARHVAGATVSIVQDGRVVLLKGYGVARPGQPVDPSRDLFRIGSISKTFTWIALMQAVERGQARLEDPVNAYLPPRLRIPDQGFARPVRLVDLMSHAAGFEVVERNHLTLYDAGRIIPPAEELRLHRPDRVRAPGVLSSYSNYGAALAGDIVARLAREDFPTLVEHDVTGPLGMSSTTFREPYPSRPDLPAPLARGLARRLATGFDWTGDHYQPVPFEFIAPSASAGSASTTAADMARYMLMQLGGGRLAGAEIYGPATALAFRTPIMKTPAGVNGWAHGLMVRTMPGGYLSYGHGGSLDHFYSNLVVVPDLRLGVFISTNTSTGRPLAEALPQLIIQRFYAPQTFPPKRAGSALLARTAGLYAGRYITTRRAYSGLEAFADLLESDDRVSVTADGYLLTVLDGQVRAWVPDDRAQGSFVDAQGSERLAFTLGAQGRAIRFPFARGTYWAERAGPLMARTPLVATAGLVLVFSIGAWIDAAGRWLRGDRWHRWGAASRILILVMASCWLLAFGALWGSGLLEGERPQAHFPGPLLLTASWAALAATGATALAAVASGAAVAEGLRTTQLSRGRVAAGLAALLASAALGVLVAARGGLTPWA